MSEKKLSQLGVDLFGKGVAGSYIQKNDYIAQLMVRQLLKKNNVILMDLAEAIDKLSRVKNYLWKVLKPEKDKYTKEVYEEKVHGTLLYVPPGTHISMPIQSCFFISSPDIVQKVHNIIILDKNSEITLNTTCAAVAGEASHFGITEIYVKENARLNYVMIHGWTPETFVRPRTGAIVEKGGKLNMFYANLKPVKDIQSFPLIILYDKASVNTTSILLGIKDSKINIGTKIILKGEYSSGEILSRAIAQDTSSIIMPAEIESHAQNTKGHIDCKGLQLSNNSYIESIPILRSYIKGSELTHEATIGKLSEEGLIYLMSKGFNEDEATSLLVRGFIDVGLDHLPKIVRPQINVALNIIAKLAKG